MVIFGILTIFVYYIGNALYEHANLYIFGHFINLKNRICDKRHSFSAFIGLQTSNGGDTMKIGYAVFLFIPIMLSATFDLNAEEKIAARDGVGYFMMGYEAADLSDVNDALEESNLNIFLYI